MDAMSGNEPLPQQAGTPVVHGKYQSIMGYFQPDIVPDSPNWFVWLGKTDIVHFAFYELDSDECLCRVHKRDNRWYAYRNGRNKVREIEIGSGDKVTIAALWDAYRHLIDEEKREQGSLTRQT
jgi:hypothetical protein